MRHLFIVAAIASSLAAGQQTQTPPPPPKPPPTADPTQQIQQIDRAMAALDMLQKSADLVAAEKTYKCMNVIGSAPFCGCLVENLPIVVDFVSYVKITTSTPEELGYAGLSADNKKLVDNSMAVRDKCVAKVFPPK